MHPHPLATDPTSPSEWLWTSWTEAGFVAITGVAILLATIAVIRIVGLRSLSKMSSFDFAVTVAIGSTLGSTAASTVPLAHGVLSIAVLLSSQALISFLRRRTDVQRIVDNRPMLLVRDGEYLDGAMTSCRITRDDVRAKLRGAGVASMADVRAVVLETTGDVSVVLGGDVVEDELLLGVDLRFDPLGSG